LQRRRQETPCSSLVSRCPHRDRCHGIGCGAGASRSQARLGSSHSQPHPLSRSLSHLETSEKASFPFNSLAGLHWVHPVQSDPIQSTGLLCCVLYAVLSTASAWLSIVDAATRCMLSLTPIARIPFILQTN
jgi:hypothetical protein